MPPPWPVARRTGVGYGVVLKKLQMFLLCQKAKVCVKNSENLSAVQIHQEPLVWRASKLSVGDFCSLFLPTSTRLLFPMSYPVQHFQADGAKLVTHKPHELRITVLEENGNKQVYILPVKISETKVSLAHRLSVSRIHTASSALWPQATVTYVPSFITVV